MSTHEQFPTTEDWEDLWSEMENDEHNPRGNTNQETHYFGKPIEPDWDSLLEDN